MHLLFGDQLDEFGDKIESGKSFILTLGVRERDEGNKSLIINTLSSLDDRGKEREDAAAQLMRVFVRDAAPITPIARQLRANGSSPVSFILIKEEGAREVEIALPGQYAVSGSVARAIKSVGGVVDVELV